jgi:hypothetical protein
VILVVLLFKIKLLLFFFLLLQKLGIDVSDLLTAVYCTIFLSHSFPFQLSMNRVRSKYDGNRRLDSPTLPPLTLILPLTGNAVLATLLALIRPFFLPFSAVQQERTR